MSHIMSSRYVLILGGLLALASCAVTKTPTALGGSRADGIVVMGYTEGLLEYVEPDWAAAQREAASRCRAWGYSDASAFGKSNSTCEIRDDDGVCSVDAVSRSYQCTN